MSEQWRPVERLPGYFVSDQGRVMGPRGGVLKIEADKFGYYRFGCRGTTAQVHRLVLEAFVGPCPPGLEARHLDGDPGNNTPGNLTWGTHAENMQDRLRHGTHPMASKTHCKRGHEFTEENTYRPPNRAQRTCRTCERERLASR